MKLATAAPSNDSRGIMLGQWMSAAWVKSASAPPNEEMRAIDKRIKAGTLPPEMQQFMEEDLQFRRQEAAKRDQVEDED